MDTLPHNLEAERAVLGAILVNNERFAEAASQLTPQRFFRDAHKRIFEALIAMQERGVALDLILLVEELSKRGDLDEVGGPAYVASLIDGVPGSTNVKHYAEVVAEKARLRDVIHASSKTIAAAYEGSLSATAIVNAAASALVASVPLDAGAVLVEQEMAAYYGQVAAGTLPQPMATGFTDVDRLLRGGFRPGDLAIVAARPSVGKTGWATKVADYTAHTLGRVCVFFSLEMTAQQIAARLLALRSHVPASRIESGDVSAAEAHRIAAAVESNGIPFVVVCSADTPTQVSAWCKTIRRQYGELALIVVDYLQLMTAVRRRDSDEAEIASVSKALKRIALEEKAVMLALSQLSRAPEGRRDKRPHLSDLRGSGALEQDADVAILLYRGDMHGSTEDEGTCEVIVAKHRNGPVGTRRLAFVKELAMFSDLADEEHVGD